MKFSDLQALFDKCVKHYAEETAPDDECNVIVIFSDKKRGMTLSNDESLHPAGENISDILMIRIGLMATALWCGLQRDYGQQMSGGIGLDLGTLLGALGGSQEESDDETAGNESSDHRIV